MCFKCVTVQNTFIIMCFITSAFGLHVLIDQCDDAIGDNLNRYHRLKRPHSHRCAQLITTSQHHFKRGECVLKQLARFNLPVYTRSLDNIMGQFLDDNTPTVAYKYCPSIIVLSDEQPAMQKLFQSQTNYCHKMSCQRFYPHAWILLIGQGHELGENVLNNIRENVLHVFTVNRWFNESLRYSLLGQSIALGNRNRSHVEQFVHSFHVHPLFTATKSRILMHRPKKTFRIGLYECPPFVFVQRNQSEGIESFDGLEYRFIKEVTKGWNVKYFNTPITLDAWYPHSINQLKSNDVDLAMCSTWVTKSRADLYDLATQFSFNCGTFLVPKPVVLNASANVYKCLECTVWVLLLFSMAVSSLCMVGFSSVHDHQGLNYGRDPSRSLLDLVNMATSHGLWVWPNQNSLKWIVMSWIMFCLLIDVIYSTAYTTFMTKPQFTKPVDTLRDFVDKGFKWGCFEYQMDLETSSVDDYKRLYSLHHAEHNIAERSRNVRENRQYALYTDVINDRYLTGIGPVISDVAQNMRLMRTCVQSCYATFALKRNSPHTKYFSERILTYNEAGILTHWMSQILLEDDKRVLFDQLSSNAVLNTKHEPCSLTVDNLKGAPYVLVILSALSMVVFSLELYIGRKSSL